MNSENLCQYLNSNGSCTNETNRHRWSSSERPAYRYTKYGNVCLPARKLMRQLHAQQSTGIELPILQTVAETNTAQAAECSFADLSNGKVEDFIQSVKDKAPKLSEDGTISYIDAIRLRSALGMLPPGARIIDIPHLSDIGTLFYELARSLGTTETSGNSLVPQQYIESRMKRYNFLGKVQDIEVMIAPPKARMLHKAEEIDPADVISFFTIMGLKSTGKDPVPYAIATSMGYRKMGNKGMIVTSNRELKGKKDASALEEILTDSQQGWYMRQLEGLLGMVNAGLMSGVGRNRR